MTARELAVNGTVTLGVAMLFFLVPGLLVYETFRESHLASHGKKIRVAVTKDEYTLDRCKAGMFWWRYVSYEFSVGDKVYAGRYQVPGSGPISMSTPPMQPRRTPQSPYGLLAPKRIESVKVLYDPENPSWRQVRLVGSSFRKPLGGGTLFAFALVGVVFVVPGLFFLFAAGAIYLEACELAFGLAPDPVGEPAQ